MDYQSVVGQRLGPGAEILIDRARLEAFGAAVGHAGDHAAQLFLVVSLLPALAQGFVSPFPTPRLTINYGLNRARLTSDVNVGDRLSAIYTFDSIEEVGSSLQVTRLVEVSSQNARQVALVETVTRLVF